METGPRVQKSRNPMKLAIVVMICLLLTYCAHRLYSAWGNNVSPVSVNLKNSEPATPERADVPRLANKETISSSDISHALSRSLNKDVPRQEERPVASNPVKAKSLTQAAQNQDSEQRQETFAASQEVINKTKNLLDNNRPGSPHHETQATVAGTVAQTVEIHQDALEENTGGALAETFTEPISGMEFILVRGGCYQMGSNLTAFVGPVHEVCVDDFYLSQYEVTQRQWKILMGRDFSYFKGNGRPVERITWDDTQRFISQLNSRSGTGYRLPTEAEWEYAARSGGKDKLYAGTGDEESLPRFAWHQVNSNRQTHMAGVKKPNSLGLYDMSGNVWEWCSDWYDDNYYAISARNNPQGPDSGRYRVIRGGEWELPAGLSRTTYREAAKPNARRSDIGFRLALTLPK